MRRIRKLPSPASLIEYRAIHGSTYDGYPYKQTLREQLVREQRGLCCYCLCRIRPGEQGLVPPMKIAHWRSQHLHPGEQLDYSNLLGACMGDKGDPPSSQSCDTSQGDRDVKWNPAEPGHGIDNRIRYLEDGTIKSDDAEFNEQITRILNLNSKFLTNSRRGLLEVFLKSLGSKGLKRRPLEKLLREWNGESDNDQLEPYCQIIVCWLRKRLARA